MSVPVARSDPPDLLAIYQQAATEDAREQAALALARHHLAIIQASKPYAYDGWYAANMAYIHWHVTAGNHRANAIAQRIPSPFDRPCASPRDAAFRYLWAYRHWRLEDVCHGSGGHCDAAWDVTQHGETIQVRHTNEPKPHVCFKVRPLWRELFGDGTPGTSVQLSLF